MKIAKKSLGILLLSLPLAASAQEKPEKHPVTKIGINYSVDYSFRYLKTDDNSEALMQEIIRNRNEMEKPIVGFNAGFMFLHQFRKGLILEGGIQYSSFGEKIPKIYTTSPQNPEVAGEASIFNHYDYLSVPIKIGYGFQIGKRITLTAATGLSTQYFMVWRERSSLKYNDGSTQEIKQNYTKYPYSNTKFTQFTFASVSSIGVDIQLTNSFSLKLEPTARFFLNPMMDAPIREKLYSYGINTTFFYTFHQRSKPKIGTMSLDF